MDTKLILLILPLLIIFSYLFDAFSRKTKFPSVLLLLGTGIIARAFADWSGFVGSELLNELIAVLGTVGLILIVLDSMLHRAQFINVLLLEKLLLAHKTPKMLKAEKHCGHQA